MSIRGRLFRSIILAFVLCATWVQASSVKLKLNGTELVEGSALSVQIVAEGSDIEFPDIKDIGGFPVESRRVSSKVESSYINGNFSSRSLKTLSFEFYPETSMKIPSFDVKIDGKIHSTEAVDIRVLRPSEVTAKSVDGYELSIQSSHKSIYVSEPFTVTVNFLEPFNSRVAKVEYVPPVFKGFFSQSLGEEKTKQTATGVLHQLEYLLSAKKDGNITIMPPKARVGVQGVSSNMDPWGYFANDIKWYSVRARPISVEVKSVPANVDLIGVFEASSMVNQTKVKANSPVTYTLRISGEGNLDDLANPKFDLPGVTVYGDKPQITSKTVAGKVLSQYERKYVFISDKDFVIPALYFKVFDYKAKKTKSIKTKRHIIKVKGSPSATKASMKKTKKPQMKSSKVIKDVMPAIKKVEDVNQSVLEDVDYYKEQNISSSYPVWAVVLSYMLGLLSGVMLMMFGGKLLSLFGSKTMRKYSPKEALEILYPYTNEDKKIEAMVRKLYKLKNGDKSIKIDNDEVARLIEAVQDI